MATPIWATATPQGRELYNLATQANTIDNINYFSDWLVVVKTFFHKLYKLPLVERENILKSDDHVIKEFLDRL